MSGSVRLKEAFRWDDREALFAVGRRIVALVAKAETFKPSFDVVGVSKGLLLSDDSFDYGESIANEVLQEIC